MSVSIVVNYYNNQRCLEPFLDQYQVLSARYGDFFELILVDDHSHERADPEIFKGIKNLRVFRMVDDVLWNMPGARNAGALEARHEQIYFTDVDHILEPDQMSLFVEDSRALQRGLRLFASRKRFKDRDLNPHVNCFLIHRQDFFRVGGYEEMFSGHYGQEDKHFRYCCRFNGVEDTPSRFKITAIWGGSTKGLERDKSRNEAIIEALHSTHTVKPRKAFQFSYERIV